MLAVVEDSTSQLTRKSVYLQELGPDNTVDATEPLGAPF